MELEFEKILADKSWSDARLSVGNLLGISKPVPPCALRRAMVERRYRETLFAYKDDVNIVHRLLRDSANTRYRLNGDETDVSGIQYEGEFGRQFTNVELVSKAGKALVKWVTSGFSSLAEESLIRRSKACQACPELVSPPRKVIYKINIVTKSDDRICRVCGCTATRKMRIPSERCPRPHPDEPYLSRWGEPL